MSIAFSRSMLSLSADSSRRSIIFLMATSACLGAWIAWFLLARVTLYEISDSARVEVSQAAHRIESPVDGEVVAVHVALGQRVSQGDVLIELDTRALQHEHKERAVRLIGLDVRIGIVRAQIEAQEHTLREQRSVTRARIDEAKAHNREAETDASLAEREGSRAGKLRLEGLLSEADSTRAESAGKMRRAASDASLFALTRIEAEQRAKESEISTDILKLKRDLADFEASRGEEVSMSEGIDRKMNERRISAPTSGQVGEISLIQVGSFLHQGDRVASVVPEGVLKIVASYAPARATGRIRPGKLGRLRLDGFPWTQYGSFPVTVTSVGSEVRDGHVRVELDVRTSSESVVLLQHGLPGSVEVEVERISPAALVLRAVGERLHGSIQGSDP